MSLFPEGWLRAKLFVFTKALLKVLRRPVSIKSLNSSYREKLWIFQAENRVIKQYYRVYWWPGNQATPLRTTSRFTPEFCPWDTLLLPFLFHHCCFGFWMLYIVGSSIANSHFDVFKSRTFWKYRYTLKIPWVQF